MTYLLDTNVLCEIFKPDTQADARVLAWWEDVTNRGTWLIPVSVLAEMQEGAEATPSPSRRAQLISRIDTWCSGFSEFILPWDADSARMWGRLKHSPEAKRQPQTLWDSLIDAMAVQHGAVIATRNGKDFRHAETFNPWTF